MSFEQEEPSATQIDPRSVASFSLTEAPNHEWDIRNDEQIIIEFELETVVSQSTLKGYLTCCVASYTFITLPFVGIACCFFSEACKRANRIPNSRFFITDRAVYYHLDPHYESEDLGCCGTTHIRRNLRIPFGEISEVSDSTSEMMFGGECWYCCSPPEGYGFLSISNRNLVHVRHGDHHATRYETVQIPLVHHPQNVIRLLRFLRDSTLANRVVDWDSVRNQMKDHQ